jgi:Fic family protein
VGRLLLPLLLFQKRVLSSPSFYFSAYFEAHRDAYYNRLQAISGEGDWNGWIEFFLEAVLVQSRDNEDRVRSLRQLYERMKTEIRDLTRSQYSSSAVDALFHTPIFQTSAFVQRSAIPRQTALPMLKTLREAGILEEVRAPSGRRPGILAFPELLDIVEGRVVSARAQA